jgi:hypothetical protein
MSAACSTTFSTVQAVLAHLASELRMRSSGALVAAALWEGGRRTVTVALLLPIHTLQPLLS